jgi:hypothetical protein
LFKLPEIERDLQIQPVARINPETTAPHAAVFQHLMPSTAESGNLAETFPGTPPATTLS